MLPLAHIEYGLALVVTSWSVSFSYPLDYNKMTLAQSYLSLQGGHSILFESSWSQFVSIALTKCPKHLPLDPTSHTVTLGDSKPHLPREASFMSLPCSTLLYILLLITDVCFVLFCFFGGAQIYYCSGFLTSTGFLWRRWLSLYTS